MWKCLKRYSKNLKNGIQWRAGSVCGSLMSECIPSHARTVICFTVWGGNVSRCRASPQWASGGPYTIEDRVFSSGQRQGLGVRMEFMAGKTPSPGDRSLSSSEDESGKEGEREMPEEGSADPAKVRGGLGTRLGSSVALARSCLSSSCCPFPSSPCSKEPRPDSDSPSDSSRGGELLPSSLNRESKYWANSSTAWLGFPLDSWGGGVRTFSASNCLSATPWSQSSLSLSVGWEPTRGLSGAFGVLLGLYTPGISWSPSGRILGLMPGSGLTDWAWTLWCNRAGEWCPL